MASVSTGNPGADPPGWELAFRFESGRLCLAFCATVGERWQRNFERLRSPDDLARWLVAAALLPAAPQATNRALAGARVLREAVYRAVRAGVAGEPAAADDRETINAWARHRDLGAQLGANGTRAAWPGTDPVRACLSTLARDAIDLLTGPELARVRECAAADCALLFLDRSRPGQRRWCSDRGCGSRARSATYRRRLGSSRKEELRRASPALRSGLPHLLRGVRKSAERP